VREVGAGDLEPPLVHPLLGADAVELDLRGIVGLDRVTEIRVDLLDLGEDLARLRLLRLDLRRLRCRGSRERQRRRGAKEEEERVSSSRSDAYLREGAATGANTGPGAVTGGGL
jgi:hypothetical protein